MIVDIVRRIGESFFLTLSFMMLGYCLRLDFIFRVTFICLFRPILRESLTLDNLFS